MNQLGPFFFLSLSGVPLGIASELLVLSRPGVAGVAVWNTNQRGKEFTLRSAVDAVNFLHARSLYQQYRVLIGAGPVALMWGGLPMTDETTGCLVLDVQPVQPRGIDSLLIGVGGREPPSYGWVECDWKLILVKIEE